MRQCGDCQLCCKLLPVRELGKGANTRCRHQKHGKGCGVYGKPAMPPSCTLWSCRWLVEDRSEDLRRPDRAGYVIDIMPDFVTVRDEETGESQHLPVLQVWVDPTRPDAWRKDKAFLDYVARLGVEEAMCALIRNGADDAIFLAPPAVNKDGTWFEHGSSVRGPTHTAADFVKAGFGMKMVMEAPL